ncbi:MAG: ABC transporter permease [Nostoc sp.]|uniref:ABC transporter permease n=1 Tax=Nostoc sp. TaxID=1180 RepID=UPI002FF18F5E
MKKRFTRLVDIVLSTRFWALLCKEVRQLSRNPQLLRASLVPPTIILVLFGFALNTEFQNLKIGITDYSSSSASRQLIEIFDQTDAFTLSQYYTDSQMMTADLAIGKLTVGITIPPEFANDIARDRTAQLQVIYDAVDANTANIASNYINQLIGDYNSRQASKRPNATDGTSWYRKVQAQISVLYNPGLKISWFILSGMLGVVLTTIASQTASALIVHEKEAGTIEQLSMTPASTTEVILAKVTPLLFLLTFDALIALFLGKLFFDFPIRSNLLVFLSIAFLYFWVGLSIGILLASSTENEQQTQLFAFFINTPLISLGGPLTPISAMPTFLQWLSYLNPLRYFVEVCRGTLLKGVGFETVWPQVLVLLTFVIVLMTLSIRQFRRMYSAQS